MSTISPQYSNRAEIADQYKTQQAEKEEVKSTNDTEINNMKKAYAAEKANLEDRFETSIQSERGAHYDHLRNTKQQMTKEEVRLQHAHNEVIDQKMSNNAREESKVDLEGRAKIADALRKYSAAEEYERSRTAQAEQEVRSNHHKSAELIISDSQKKLNALGEEKSEYLEKQKESHAVALDQMQDHYQGIRDLKQKQYTGEVNQISATADAELNSRRLFSAQKLGTFADKQSDPFYAIKKFDSQLTDAGDAYILRVKLPDYERGHFKLQVSGQEMQLNGVRSSDEEATLEPGRSIATRTYQNVSERYVLDSPVDGRSVSFKENADGLTYTIPKFGPNHRVADQFRRPVQVADDTDPTKELSFKDSLPAASNAARTPPKT